MEETRKKIQAFLNERVEGDVALTLFIPHQNEKYGMVYAVEYTVSGENETVSWFCLDGKGQVKELNAGELSDTIEI